MYSKGIVDVFKYLYIIKSDSFVKFLSFQCLLFLIAGNDLFFIKLYNIVKLVKGLRFPAFSSNQLAPSSPKACT